MPVPFEGPDELHKPTPARRRRPLSTSVSFLVPGLPAPLIPIRQLIDRAGLAAVICNVDASRAFTPFRWKPLINSVRVPGRQIWRQLHVQTPACVQLVFCCYSSATRKKKENPASEGHFPIAAHEDPRLTACRDPLARASANSSFPTLA